MKTLLTLLAYFLLISLVAQEPRLIHTFDGHFGSVNCANFSPDGTNILTASYDQTIKLWDLNGRFKTTFKGHADWINSAIISPDGSKVLTASGDRTAKLWDLNGNLLTTFKGHENTVYSASFSPDGSKVLTASFDQTAKLWDVSGNLLTTFKGHNLWVYSAVFSPDGSKVLTASGDGTARLWNLKAETIITFKGHNNTVYSAAFSPDGSKVLTTSLDSTAKLWTLNGNLLTTLKGHRRWVYDAAFSPDGSKIVTASGDATAILWDLEGYMIIAFNGHKKGINSVAFSPDGLRLITASDDSTAKLWDLTEHLRSKPALTYALKPTLPPNLTIENPQVLGLGKNNILDGGETVMITAIIKNSGKGTAYGLEPALTSNLSGLSAKASTIRTLEPGASQEVSFKVSAPENLPQGTAELTIDIKEANKFHPEPLALAVTTAPFVPPAPMLADYKLEGQDFIRLGQTAKVTGIIQNNSRAVAKAVRITAAFPPNVYAATDAVLTLGDMQPNAKANFEFEFTANREFKDKELVIDLKIEESTGRFGKQEKLKLAVNAASGGKKVVIIGPAGGSTEPLVSPLASLTSDVDKDIPTRKGGEVPNRFALIIGNEDYKSNQTGASAAESNVAFAKADAASFKKYCQSVLGVPYDHIIMATDMELNEMKREINRLKKLIELEKGKAEVIFYYSGHGLPHPETKKPVLLAIDKTADEAADCLELEWIAKTLTSQPHSRIMMFVDACFSGMGKGQANLLAKKGTRVKPSSTTLSGNMVIISSSSADEPSEIFDEQQHGFFTYHLLKTMKQNAMKPMTTKELFEQLTDKVQKNVLLKKGTTQTPTIQPSPTLGTAWEGWVWW